MAFRVCHVITRLIVGGAQENTILTCRGLAERGHHVTLVTGAETGAEGDLIPEARSLKCSLIVLDSLVRDPRPLKDLQALGGLVSLFRNQNPDIVHTHSSKAGVLGRLAARIAGVPIVIHTNHGLPFHDRQPAAVNWMWRLAERVSGRFADRLICVGAAAREESIRARLAPAGKHSVIYSGMITGRFSDATGEDVRRIHDIPAGVPVLGSIGRFSPQKSPADFLAVARIVLSARPDAWILWAGDGPLREEMVSAARASGHGGRIRFAGLIPPDKVAHYLAAMDVVGITSLWEGLPRVAIQAALARRPVVAYAVPGTTEAVVDGQTGFVVPIGKPSAMADRVLELLRRPDRGHSMGEAGHELFAARFDWRRMVEAIEALYAAEIGRRRNVRSR